MSPLRFLNMPKVHTRQAGNCLLLVDACERSYGNCFCSTSLLTFVMNTEAKTSASIGLGSKG